MIKWIFKYSVAILLFNTVVLSIQSTSFIGDQIFLVLMALYALLLLISPNQIKNVILHKAFSFLLILSFLNLVYFFMFHSITDIKGLNYLLARAAQFSMIAISIHSHYEYYKTKFLRHLVYLIAFIVFLGILFDPNVFSGRYGGIIWNPNMLASFTSIAFAVLFLLERQKTRVEYFLMLVFVTIALSTGSRGVLIAIALSFVFKYGFSNRIIIYSLLCLFAASLIINSQLDTSVNRFVSQGLFNDRLFQYEFALETVLNKLYSGYGLDKYSYIDKNLIDTLPKGTVIGAHNGYLAILTQYGVVFGSIVLFIILKKSIQVTIYFRDSIDVSRTYLFILIYALFASVYETLLTGINEFHTILFWFSLAFLSYSNFRKVNEI